LKLGLALVLLFPAAFFMGGTVAVVRKGDTLAIKVDNHYTLGDNTAGRGFEERQAHFPLLLHPDPRSAFFIGLGTGLEVFPQVRLWRGDFLPRGPIVALVGQVSAGPLDSVPLLARAEHLVADDAGEHDAETHVHAGRPSAKRTPPCAYVIFLHLVRPANEFQLTHACRRRWSCGQEDSSCELSCYCC